MTAIPVVPTLDVVEYLPAGDRLRRGTAAVEQLTLEGGEAAVTKRPPAQQDEVLMGTKYPWLCHPDRIPQALRPRFEELRRMQPGTACHVLRYSRVVLLILVLAAVSTPAAQPDSSKTRQQEVDLERLGYVGVGAAGLHWYGFRQLEKNWWQGERVPLRLVHDWAGDSYLNLDHASHFMWGLSLAQVTGDLYHWIGFSPRTAALLGSLSSIAEMFYVEYRDGRYGHWGFSTPDATADVLGALVPLIHASVPATQIVQFKLSYFPSPLLRYGHVRQAGGHPYVLSFMDDYEGMTFWMVIDPRPLLPGHAAERWPDWLGAAVGVGGQGLHGYGRKSRGPDRWDPDLPDAQREIYLSLDFDFAHSLGNYEALRRFVPYFRLLRFPTPALRIHPTPTLYLLYF